MRIIKNKKEWNNLLEKEFGEYNDSFFRYDYFSLYGKHYNAEPEAVFWQDNNLKIFWSHLVRKIDSGHFDLTTPYGYGGPLIVEKKKNKKTGLNDFWSDYKNYALEKNYVSEFVRFHPVYRNWRFFDSEYLNDVVLVDLKKNLEEIWKKIKKGHRYNIKKSLKEGCKIKIIKNPSFKNIDNFSSFYYSVMDKNKAQKKYYFSRDFIRAHLKMPDSFLIEAICGEKVIGSSIFLAGDKIIHYFLSGAKDGLKGLYPSNLILWEAIKTAKENNFKWLHLGGGRGKNDSLFDFKKGFSNFTKPFKIGKIIFNQDFYNKLIEKKNKNKLSAYSGKNNSSFFPKYRRYENSII